MKRILRFAAALLALGGAMGSAASAAAEQAVILDTDIGTDIDDAYALAALVNRPGVELVGVTTVSSDAAARARLAAKLLQVAGGKGPGIPVYAGLSTPTQYMKQVEWAAGFTSPSLHETGGVEFLRREINRRPGRITLIAVGELTNIAALLESEPGIAQKIHAIALMGGAVYRGYAPGSKPEPEWNIKSNAKAARTVFTSGVPLRVAPLDSTADLKLTPELRVRIFTHGTPLGDALGALDQIWRYTNHWKGDLPTLFDVLAVELALDEASYELRDLRLEVTDEGLTRPIEGAPNAKVAVSVDVARFMEAFVARVTR
jgi:inosine-uridine nucleoside N-ribohydrolase